MEKNASKPDSINRDFSLFCPWFGEKAKAAIDHCNEDGYQVAIFEGYRSPNRQNYLYEQGRTRKGKIITAARAWNSWHQYALALDLAFFDGRAWSWDGNWDKVQSIMEQHGFESLKFERPHFQITAGISIAEAQKLAQKSGMRSVWDLVKLRGKF